MLLKFYRREKGRGKKKWGGKREGRKRKRKDGWYRWDGHISREEEL